LAKASLLPVNEYEITTIFMVNLLKYILDIYN
jgi:hypothetical protein